MLPAAPFKVTTSTFSDTDMNGDWIYMGGAKKVLSEEGDMKLTLPLKQYVALNGAAVTQLLTTAT